MYNLPHFKGFWKLALMDMVNKKAIGIFLTLFVLLFFVNGILSSEDPVLTDHAQKKKILYFYQEHCPYCRQMDTFVLSNYKVEEILNRYYSYDTVDFRSVDGGKLADQYHVKVTPSFIILDQKGNHTSIVGSYDADRFIRLLIIEAAK